MTTLSDLGFDWIVSSSCTSLMWCLALLKNILLKTSLPFISFDAAFLKKAIFSRVSSGLIDQSNMQCTLMALMKNKTIVSDILIVIVVVMMMIMCVEMCESVEAEMCNL
jgi:hypothetical protein